MRNEACGKRNEHRPHPSLVVPHGRWTPACSQSFVLGEIAQFGLSPQVAGCANPAGGPDFSALASRPVAAGAAESLFYFVDHFFPNSRFPGARDQQQCGMQNASAPALIFPHGCAASFT
jgi:hypothetical protein